jgi:hypothetical protein
VRITEEGRVDLKRRILGRRAHEDDRAGLDMRQKGVLLGLVESMDFVDEEGRAATSIDARVLSRGDDVFDLLDARRHGAERHEVRVCEAGQDAPECRLARARRAPEDQGVEGVARHGLAEGPAFADQMRLTDELLECPRAQALRERRAG